MRSLFARRPADRPAIVWIAPLLAAALVLASRWNVLEGIAALLWLGAFGLLGVAFVLEGRRLSASRGARASRRRTQ